MMESAHMQTPKKNKWSTRYHYEYVCIYSIIVAVVVEYGVILDAFH